MTSPSVYTLHVRRSGQGRPLVLLHGVAGSGALWSEVAKELAHGYDVIRLDLLGYGYSPKPKLRYQMQTHLDAIRHTLAQLGLSEPPALVGLSMGSMLALEYAARYPDEVQSVICIGLPYYRSAAEARERLRASFWTNLVIHHPVLARLVVPIVWGFGRNKLVAHIVTALYPKNTLYKGETAREVMMATYHSFSSTLHECMVNFRLDKNLAQVRVPVLFIHGAEDKWTPTKTITEIAQRLPNAQLIVMPDHPHNIVSFAPATVTPLIRTFLTSHTKEAHG